MHKNSAEITKFLADFSAGSDPSSPELLIDVYDDLRGMARRHMMQEGIGHTLEPTALVNELWTRIAASRGAVSWPSRGHFFRWASTSMRHILCDYARKKKSEKAGGRHVRIALEGLSVHAEGDPEDLALDFLMALEELAELNPEMTSVIEMRSISGMSYREIAEALEVSERQVTRTLNAARGWLKARLAPDQP